MGVELWYGMKEGTGDAGGGIVDMKGEKNRRREDAISAHRERKINRERE